MLEFEYGKSATQKKVLEFIEHIHREGWPCPFCHELTWCRAVFFPDDPEAWGAPKGKQRGIAYGYCPECAEKFGAKYEELIEDYIAHTLGEGVPIWDSTDTGGQANG